MSNPPVTILIVNYRTPEVTRLCLRLLRRHTDPALARVLVIDNGSADTSLDYLRSLRWIGLLERAPEPGERVAAAHARALDFGLAQVDTPFVLSLHTDSFVRDPGWLPFLLAPFEGDPKLAGVGSWKLEQRPPWSRALKAVERGVQRVTFPLLGRGYGQLEGLGDNWYYLRSHCALYRTAPLRTYGLGFADGGMVAGKLMHRRLTELGYAMRFLPSSVLSRHLLHVNHATMVLNPELGADRRTIAKGRRRLARILADLDAGRVLADSSLDA